MDAKEFASRLSAANQIREERLGEIKKKLSKQVLQLQQWGKTQVTLTIFDLLAAKAAFDSVEGEGFFDRSLEYGGQDSIKGVMAYLAEGGEHYSNLCIYGAGGFNRYFVREDGTIVFSERHAHSGHTAKAVAAGFGLLDNLPQEEWR